ncbi:hypothetical protein LSCM4_02451 [Leishmania orientalis]|uniref:t-SNARE coiled-coil homology domain-containing protein n=1 Tax=Leishmania orientalis TaxID=2249476 RepID=A0A836KFN8_9TRYP|nr:hypothetical protein LSCM4_02451 [Leishmania orientalis]
MEVKLRDRFIEFSERRAALRTRDGRFDSATQQELSEQLLIVPLWSRLPSDFEENALTLFRRIEQLRSMHLNFLKPKLRSKEEEDELRVVIDKQAAEIQTFLKMLEHAIIVGTQLKNTYSEEEVRVVKNVQMHLTLRLQDLALHFKSAQELFGTQLYRRERKSTKYMKIGSDAAYSAVQQEERTAHFLEMGFTEQDVQSLLIEEMQRDRTSKEIRDILGSIQEIHRMFEDLRTMVVDQGTMLDRIDYNVDKALASASKAQIELEKARDNSSGCIFM